jgi:hypothetical protein
LAVPESVGYLNRSALTSTGVNDVDRSQQRLLQLEDVPGYVWGNPAAHSDDDDDVEQI